MVHSGILMETIRMYVIVSIGLLFFLAGLIFEKRVLIFWLACDFSCIKLR